MNYVTNSPSGDGGNNIFFDRIKQLVLKKSFVLRIDEATYKALEKWANDEFRSVNGQIEWVLDQKLKEAGRIKPPAGDKATGEKKK